MDVCQTGLYDSLGGDMVLGDASQMGFIVQEPAVLPPLDLSPMKTNASEYVTALSDTKIGPKGAQVTIPGGCSLYKKLGNKVPAATFLAGLFQTTLTYCADLIGHYEGLAADPPDPNYKVFAELGNIGYGSFSASTPLERAARTLANALGDQDAATNAFLNSIQKFQGAQQAGDDEWSMLQLMQMNKFINLLIGPGGSMLRTYAALEAFNIALQKDPLGTTQEAQDLEAFLPTLRQTLGAMLTPLGGFFQPHYDPNTGGKLLSPVGLQAYIEVYLGLYPIPAELPGIPQERALAGLPPIVLPYPTASTGGNYNAAPGAMITFNAGTSTDPSGGSLTYAWDLNGNGTFTDATGAQPQYSYSQPGTRTIGVKVTDSGGFTNVAYALVHIGDVNSEDIITESGNDQIYDVHPDGSYNQLTPGVPYIDTLRKLKVEVNGDIWMLGGNNGFGTNGTYGGILHHYDSQGNLLATITPAQVGSLTGLSLMSIDDFAMDGSGKIDLTATEDLGPGCFDINLSACSGHVPGPGVAIRVAPDASSASFLDEVETRNVSVQIVNGVLIANQVPACTGLYGAGFLRVDPNNGNILVSNVNGGDPTRCDFGVFSINPTTAAITEVIPAGAVINSCCQVSDPTYGMFYSTDLTFGGSSLHDGGYGGLAPQGPGLFVLDAQGDFVIAPAQAVGGGFIGRVDVPPQITNNGGTLDIEMFPVITHTLGTPVVILNSMTVDAGGDYVGVGINFAVSFAPVIFRITPDGQIFTVNTALSPSSELALVDVVPQIRAVTPSDMPAPPAVTLSNLIVGQSSCPGSAQLSATVKNTGSTPTTLPVQVIFFDGDPGLGVAVGTATTSGPVPAGGSVTLSAPWATPSPGTHSLFALALGANTVNVEFQVCVPSQYAANPLLLSPLTGKNAIGTTHSIAAQLVDIFGGGISGVAVTFTVSGANTAAGMASTDADGNAVFSYAGKNPGQDSIVATSHNLTSNIVGETWVSTLSATTTIVVSSSNPSTAGTSVTFTASVTGNSPTGTVQFLDGSNSLGTVGLTGGAAAVSLSILSVGTHSITVVYSGDSSNSTSTSSILSEVISPAAAPPVVTPPANIAIPATQAGGATGSASPALAGFLAGGTAASTVSPAPVQLPPQVGGISVGNTTLFPVGTTTVTFLFKDANGNIGSATSAVTVAVGTPRITGSTAGIGTDPSGAIYVNVVLTNTGTGNARNLTVNTLTFRTLSGTGTVTYNTTLSPALPLAIGNLDVGTAVTTHLYLNVPSTVTRLSLTENGPVQNVLGTNYNYSTAEAVIP
jgi:Bacterial Ig-like domain (group 3)/PKD domain